ncbi:DNA-binding protein [Frankia sp. AiPs1]|uniref:Zn-ribbon domain-containing OB-fold protein n=1 Tax=Frankia sp. AiPa1 TaxID=573492 RepID=UPI00202B9D92|nr:OB-fold domain-containing protein [Frankia sp. AiPa1]MCL9759746.1 OB-fold domain-containing protein [Frankia sp. AiPa1]
MTSPAAPAAPSRPLPVPDEVSATYWEAAARHVLTVARCGTCATYVIPPDQICPACGSSDPGFAFAPVSGRGVVRSWTVVRQAFLPGFEVPFVLVDVELAVQAGLRTIGRLVDGVDAPLVLGAAVEVAFEDVTPEVSVPAFRLAGVGPAGTDQAGTGQAGAP